MGLIPTQRESDPVKLILAWPVAHPVSLEMSKVGTSEQPHGDHPRGIASESPSYKDQVLRAFYFGACPGGFSLVGGTIPLIRR